MTLLIALPPSEGKAAGGDGPAVSLPDLSFADELTRTRERVAKTLVRLCAVRTERAQARTREVLGLPPGLASELAVNSALLDTPTLPAAQRYTGVLYDHLDLPSLPRSSWESVVTLSALWGAVRPSDPIPAYRLSMGVTLGRLGKLASLWRAPLAKALPDEGLVVDCRSSAYVAAWKPGPGCDVVAVRAFVVAADGTRTVVSHNAKAARGDVARALCSAGREPSSAAEVAEVVEAAGLRCELAAAARTGAPSYLDVLLDPPSA